MLFRPGCFLIYSNSKINSKLPFSYYRSGTLVW